MKLPLSEHMSGRTTICLASHFLECIMINPSAKELMAFIHSKSKDRLITSSKISFHLVVLAFICSCISMTQTIKLHKPAHTYTPRFIFKQI